MEALARPAPAPVLIAIGVITFGRPHMLAALLRSLEQAHAPHGTSLRVIVVDNDADGSARPVIERSGMQPAVHYVVEPRRGIPVARNRVIDEARLLGADFLAFFDDDERVAPDTIERLYGRLCSDRVDAVGGPLHRRLPDDAPAWARVQEARTRHSAVQEHKRQNLATNNVLISMAFLERTGLRFDEAMRMSGGSDSDFFTRARELGARLDFEPDALVEETVPASRLTLHWQFLRFYRQSLVTARLSTKRYGRLYTFGRFAPRALGRLFSGALFLLISLPFGPAAWLHPFKDIASGAGLLVGAMGGNIDEYSKVHGH